MNGYFGPLNNSLTAAYLNQVSRGGQSQSDVAAVYTSLSGSLLEVLTGLAATVSVALGILSVLSLGPGVLVSVLMVSIIGSIPTGAGLPDLQALNGFTGTAFSAFWALLNSSLGPFSPSDFNYFATGLTVAADLGAITTEPLAAYLLSLVRPSLEGTIVAIVPVLAFASLAALASIYEVGQHNLLLNILFLFLAAGSLAACILMRPYLAIDGPGVRNIWTLVTGVSGVSVIATVSDIVADLS